MKKYAASHASAKGNKCRVHIYEKNNLGGGDWGIESYEGYAKCMKNAGVTLKFLDMSFFNRSKFETRGSLIIDQTIVAVAINPIDGAPFGELSYSDEIIRSYTERFNELWPIGEESDFFIGMLRERFTN